MTAPTLDPASRLRRSGRARSTRSPSERDAVILAHNYQVPEIQDVAHHVGDSLALSRIAATAPQSTIVFCGVHFMAETAKILSPDKTVLIPDARAGCSLADSLTADQLRAWKAQNPGAVVVSYVNTTAEVKARDRHLLHLVQRRRGGPVDPRRHPGAVRPRPVPRRARPADPRPGQHLGVGRRVPRARRDQRRPAHRAGRGQPGRRPVHPSRVRLRDQRAVPGQRRRGAGRPGEDPVHRRDGRRGQAQHVPAGAGGHRDRHDPPAAQGRARVSTSGRSTSGRPAST